MVTILTCKLGNEIINCYDGTHNKEQLKKWAKKKILICPVCEKPYEYCHGKIKIPYFRHMDKEECQSLYGEPETDEHLRGKRDLYEWLKTQDGITDVVLEGWLPTTKQRPDIMFKYNGKQHVLEYQCSPISSEYYERHELYKTAGIRDIWVCGSLKYLQYYHKGSGKKHINVLENECLQYYNPDTKHLYKIDINMNQSIYEKLKTTRYSRENNLMHNPSDFDENKTNYLFVKDSWKSYVSETYYPKGRPTRKCPYPSIRYIYEKNISLALCRPLDYVSIEELYN